MDKQRKRQEKAAERRERNAIKKAIADGTMPDPGLSQPTIYDPSALQPEAYGVDQEEEKKKPDEGGD